MVARNEKRKRSVPIVVGVGLGLSLAVLGNILDALRVSFSGDVRWLGLFILLITGLFFLVSSAK